MTEKKWTAKRTGANGRFNGMTAEVRAMIIDGSLRSGKWDAARLARFIDKDTYQGPQGQQFRLAVGSALNILAKEELINRGPKRGLYIAPGDKPQPQMDIITDNKPQPQEEKELEIGDMLEVITFAKGGIVLLRDENGTLMVSEMRELAML